MTDREAAQQILTPRQWQAWDLANRGLSQRNIALAMNLSRSGVIYLLEAAGRKLAQAQRKEPAA